MNKANRIKIVCIKTNIQNQVMMKKTTIDGE